MKKELGIRTLDDTFRCACGAMPYDPERHPHGAVGLTRYRKSKYGHDGGYSVTCCRCGSVSGAAPLRTRWQSGTVIFTNTAH